MGQTLKILFENPQVIECGKYQSILDMRIT